MRLYPAYTWEEVYRDGVEHCIEFTITVEATPCRPAVTSGPPDRWAPAEAGEVEHISTEVDGIFMVDNAPFLPKSATVKRTPDLDTYWLTRFHEEVESQDPQWSDWLAEVPANEEPAEPDENDCRDDDR